MYTAKYRGKTIRISDKDYKQLLRMFDLSRVIDKYRDYGIDVKSPFCYKYSRFLNVDYLDPNWGSCERPYCLSECPFAQFENDYNHGCINVIESFIGKRTIPTTMIYLVIGLNGIQWRYEIDKEMRFLINKIREELLKMKKSKKT